MQRLFIARNRHSAACGKPPYIIAHASDIAYAAYWENAHGEQFILTRQEGTGLFRLYTGELDWEPIEFLSLTDERLAHLILSNSELGWLGSCYEAATEGDKV